MKKTAKESNMLMKKFNVRRIISSILVVAMTVSLSACGKPSNNDTKTSTADNTGSSEVTGNGTATPENDPILTGEKPKLKILGNFQPFDYNTDPSNALIEKLTGYEVEWYALPQEQAQEKLMLEISSGADYDILFQMLPNNYSALSAQNALIPLNDMLDKYGANIKNAVSDIGWASVTDKNGVINGMPGESLVANLEDPYGSLQGGIGLRSDMLAELGLSVPSTLDEFTALLEAAKAKYGIAALTDSKTMFNTTILSAFGMGVPEWYDINGVYTPRIKHPGLPDYLAYMQKLYKEKLLDNDTPINSLDNAREKFATKNAIATPLYFWDIPTMVTALATSNPDAEVEFITTLAKDSSTNPVAYITKGNNNVTCISKNSKNPEHAINFLNILSTPENFKRVYIGEEGKSYEIKDGQYYPIFEGEGNFNDYVNSTRFTGFSDPAEAFKQWQARARKTPEMAVAYEKMNSIIDKVEFKYTIEGYGKNSPIVQEYINALNQAFQDEFIKAVVEGTDVNTAVAQMQAAWDKNGGLEVEKAMQEYYDLNKAYIYIK